MAMYSVPAASQPTVASSMKLGIFVFCAAAAGHSTATAPTRASNPLVPIETFANLDISKIRSVRRRNRFHIEAEKSWSAFGAGGFAHRPLRHAAPSLDEFQRLFERRRIIDHDFGLQVLALIGQAE